jgi:hypothetical protein
MGFLEGQAFKIGVTRVKPIDADVTDFSIDTAPSCYFDQADRAVDVRYANFHDPANLVDFHQSVKLAIALGLREVSKIAILDPTGSSHVALLSRAVKRPGPGREFNRRGVAKTASGQSRR